MRKILLIGLGVAVLTVLLSVITASLMASPTDLPSGIGGPAVAAVTASHHVMRSTNGDLGILYFNHQTGPDFRVMFVRSTDNGATWSEPDTINATPFVLMNEPPDLAVGPGGDFFAVWDASNGARGDSTDIWFSRWDADTETWDGPSLLFSGIYLAAGPRLAVTPDGVVHVVWYDESDTASDILYSYNPGLAARGSGSGDGGWASPVVIDDTDEYAQQPALQADAQGGLHLVYAEIIDLAGQDGFADELRYQSSTDGGANWSVSEELTAHAGGQSTFGVSVPAMAAMLDSTLHVAWVDDDGGGRDIFYAMRNAEGDWSAPLNVTGADSSEYFPAISADLAGRVDLYYEAAAPGGSLKDIYHRYLDRGGSWSSAENVSQSATLDTRGPSIVAEPVGRAGHAAVWLERTLAGAPVRYAIHFRLSDDEVWPGDADNSGVVDADDVIPLALYWTYVGPARAGAGQSGWTAHAAAPWLPFAGVYADANGDGMVDARDVLPIGLNWAKPAHTVREFLDARPMPDIDPVAIAGACRELRAALGGDSATGPAAEMVRVLDGLLAGSGQEGVTPSVALAATPNPTSGETRIHFRLAAAGDVRVAIYDARGRLVRTVLEASRPAGTGEALWDGRDDRGVPAPAGLYLARVEAPGSLASEKILRIR